MSGILAAWRGEASAQTPVWLMRQAGRYLPEYRALRERAGGFWELVYTPALAAEATMQPVRRFDMDAAILFSDILVVPHALGVKTSFLENEGPSLEPVRSSAQADRLDEAGAPARWAPVLETVERVRADLPEGKALIGFAGSPWTVASYMVEGGGGHDFTRIRAWALHEPGGFSRLVDVLIRSTIAYLDAQIKAGAQAVQLFESWAGTLTGASYDRWVVEPNERICTALHEAHPQVPVIGFTRTANLADLQQFAAHTGVNAVSIGEAVDPAWAARNLQPGLCVQGNLDPALVLTGGGGMEAAARHICNHLARGPFVFNLGHGLIKDTNPDHVAALVETVRRFRTGKADA